MPTLKWMNSVNYKKTLNLPNTSFPMRAQLPQREPETLAFWEKEDIYGRLREKRAGAEKYILHDGPPYANGHIHIGHALNKILKDLVVKTKSMTGLDAVYVPGWDCHGLPIEHQVDKLLGDKKLTMTPSQIRKRCRVFADEFIDIQRQEFKRLGVLGDWGRPYVTMDYTYEAVIVRELGDFFQKGMVYQGKKPVHWCVHCKTALAEAEVEYADHSSDSIYVRFPIPHPPQDRFDEWKGKKVYFVIWTTTPWTLPANLALTVHPDFTYVAYEKAGEVYVVARDLAAICLPILGLRDAVEIGTYRGEELEGLEGINPLEGWPSKVILGDHVTLEAGTGIVHTAPGHGQEDYEVGVRYGIDIYAPVDGEGKFTSEVKHFAGIGVFKANRLVIEQLRKDGFLMAGDKISHSYPHCWRCKKPVIFRATRQWFISLDIEGLRQKSLDEIKRVQWIPSWGEDRIYNMVAHRPDWCISRQRLWGVPIMVLLCRKCRAPVYNGEFFGKVVSMVSEKGADAWFETPVEDLKVKGMKCPSCNGEEFDKETDIVDVWFDSGVSQAAVLKVREDLEWPADLYLEGSDQHRGWFHSSLLASVGNYGRAPYRAVLTHGFTVDGQGRKMSKAVGNVVAPQEVIDRYGAEILRLWVAAEDYRSDVRLSPEIIDQLAESYRRIRNTGRFLLGNLADFDPGKDMIPYDRLEEIDRWILHRLTELSDRLLNAYRDFQFHLFYHAFHTFCVVDLSALYLDIIKDRLYVESADSATRRSAQTALWYLLDTMVRLMAPVLSFTAEEIWRIMPHPSGDREVSVHLAAFADNSDRFRDPDLAARWDRIIEVRKVISKVLEEARQSGLIGSSLEAGVTVYLDEKDPAADPDLLKQVAIVSDLEVGFFDQAPAGAVKMEEVPKAAAEVKSAPGARCERCWMISPTVGQSKTHPTICGRCVGILGE